MVIFFGTETSPSSGSSSPTIIRKSVVLPEPFGPTSPTFSPGLSWKEASTKTSCLPYCLLMEEKEIIELLCYELSAIGYRRRTPSFAAVGRPAPKAQLIADAEAFLTRFPHNFPPENWNVPVEAPMTPMHAHAQQIEEALEAG